MRNGLTRLSCSALPFDLDGVLVDSIVSVEQTWRAWALRHGLDAAEILRSAHGRRAFDTIGIVAPHLDAAAEIIALSAQEANNHQRLVGGQRGARAPGDAACGLLGGGHLR